MRASQIKIVKLTPKDLADTPEGFEDRYEDRDEKEERRPVLESVERLGMSQALEKFNIGKP